MSDSIKKHEEMQEQPKYITDELIEERLTMKGYSEQDSHDEEHVMDAVCKHFDLTLTDEWKSGYDYYIYEDTTADGYEVYISTYDFNKISVSENVFQHDSDMSSEFKEAVYNNDHGDVKFYVSDIYADFINDAMCELYIDLVDLYTETVTDELIDEGYIQQADTSAVDLLNLIANND